MSRVENWTPSTQDGAVLNQPCAVKNENPSAANESYPGGVTIRTLRDDVEDAEFAARLLVDAFRGKFVHAVGENNISTITKNHVALHRGQAQTFYDNTFVAEYEGRRAGVAHIMFTGDKEQSRDDYLDELGCCAAFGYWRLEAVTEENVPPRKCYLNHIAVDESFRGKGIGKVLMERIEKEARTRQCKSIYLAVVTSNRAKSLYERQGYEVKSRESCCCCMWCCLGISINLYNIIGMIIALFGMSSQCIGDVLTKTVHNQVSFLDRLTPFMDEIVVTKTPLMSGQDNWAPPLSGYGAVFGTVFKQQPGGSRYDANITGVTIRALRDDVEDANFAAKLMIEAFRGKVVHAVGENNLLTVQKNVAVNHQGQNPMFYGRQFVAEYQGRRAGVVQLRFKGDTERERDDYLDQLGCCAMCGLLRLVVLTDEDVPMDKCYLDHIAVDAQFRGRGIGTVLMEKAEQEARARGCSAIYLTVVTTNRAKNLYERQGYVITSEETCCGCLECCLGEPGCFYMEKKLQ